MSILNKKQFCNILNNIKQTDQLRDEINLLYNKYNKDKRITSLTYEYSDTIFILEIMFNDIGEYIQYWIYDLNFGDEYKEGCITEEDNTPIPLKSPEELYDFLIKNMKEQEQKRNENKL